MKLLVLAIVFVDAEARTIACSSPLRRTLLFYFNYYQTRCFIEELCHAIGKSQASRNFPGAPLVSLLNLGPCLPLFFNDRSCLW